MKKIIVFALVIISMFVLSSCGTLTYTGDFCEDGMMDRDETDIDCGGQYCKACAEEGGCNPVCTGDKPVCKEGVCVAEEGGCNPVCTGDKPVCKDGVCVAEEGGCNPVCTGDKPVCKDGVCVAEESVIDTDGDGVPDAIDACPGYDDTVDTDADGVPDGCESNLIVSDLTLKLLEGYMGTFIVTVTNEGAVDTGAFKVILMSMDSTFTTRNDDFFATSTGLTAGNSDEFEIDVEIPFTTLPLAYMKVTVDSEDSVVEYDEADNIQMYTIDTAAS